jgi:hypothetical protein
MTTSLLNLSPELKSKLTSNIYNTMPVALFIRVAGFSLEPVVMIDEN